MNQNDDPRIFKYYIDVDDTIVDVNDEWLAFASENGTDKLLREDILGCSLWDFIVDSETRHLYEIILEKVRAEQVKISVPFRCDAPFCRRYMQLEIAPQAEKLVEFKSYFESIEPRSPVQLLSFEVERSDEFVRMCGWCKRIGISDTLWLEVEEAVERLHLFAAAKLPQLTHGICSDCKATIMQTVNMASTAAE